jgi:hypothetical protein
LVAGTISRLVNSYGSKWGHVRPDREPRQVFFNADSLVEGVDFAALAVGDAVEFEQETDRANGMRAFKLRVTAGAQPVAARPVAASSEPAETEA